MAIRFLCTILSSKMSYLSSKTVKRVLREMIYKKLLRLGAAYNEQVKTSEIVQVAVEGVDQLETYFGAYLPQFLYCKKKHGGKNGLCPECEELDAYARQRSDKCPFMETKTFCSNVKGQGMTWRTKIKIMVTVTVLMSIGFIMMDQVPVGRIVLGCVWLFHIIYFTFVVKNYRKKHV